MVAGMRRGGCGAVSVGGAGRHDARIQLEGLEPDRRGGMRVEDRHHVRELPGEIDVVGVEERDEVAARDPNAVVAGRGGAARLRRGRDDPNARHLHLFQIDLVGDHRIVDLLKPIEIDPDHGAGLWRTDGTTAGTQLVKDMRPGSDQSVFSVIGSVGGLTPRPLAHSGNAAIASMKLWILSV